MSRALNYFFMKKYKYIGSEEKVIKEWVKDFTIGKTYPEGIDTFAKPKLSKDELYLVGNDGLEYFAWVVDKSQFKLVEE